MIVNLVSLEKQSRPGNIRGYLRIQNFIEDLHLCPMAALVEYNNRVSLLKADRSSLFVSYKKPHSVVTAKTLSRWTCDLLSAAGVDTTLFQSHATRSAAGVLLSKTLSSIQLCKLANWSSTSGVYEKFYKRYL